MTNQETTDIDKKIQEAVNLLMEWVGGCQIFAFADDADTTVSFWGGAGNMLARERLVERWLIRQDGMLLGDSEPMDDPSGAEEDDQD